MLALTIGVALAETPAARVGRVWAAGSERMTTAGSLPVPALSSGDLRELARGEVVKQRRRESGSDWAVGLAWLPHPMDAIWVGIVDNEHDDLTSGLRELTLSSRGPNDLTLFQELSLPRPFDTRIWVIRLWNPNGVYTRTSGALWERVWELAPESALDAVPADFLTSAQRADGVYTPVNEGGWSFLPDGDGTLVVYQARTSVGGLVPDELVLRFAVSRLDELLLHVGELADRSVGHYDLDHAPLVRPDGSEIPRF